MRVLGIETSCDETGVAVYDTERGLLADVLYSQVAIHAEYGGVVPELASRDHVRKTLPLVDQALLEADITRADIDGVAYTAGPGLAGALMVGATLGRAIAVGLGVPSLGDTIWRAICSHPCWLKTPPRTPLWRCSYRVDIRN